MRSEENKVRAKLASIKQDNNKIEEAKRIASLKGPKGDKGDKGDMGPKGDKGEPGEDGRTPVLGVDYIVMHGKDGRDGRNGRDGIGGGDPFNNTTGAYTVRINYQQPVQAISFSSDGGTGTAITVEQIRQEIDNNSTMLQDIKQAGISLPGMILGT